MTAAQPQIRELLARAADELALVSDSARLDAELLLARAIDMPRSFLFAHAEAPLDPAAVERFDASIRRRLDGEPLAYIEGQKEFWSLELMVSPATLVPRPETELLVEHVLREIPRRGSPRILDLGTGSGAIALALASDRPMSEVTAVDISEAALAVAQQNARQLQITNIRFLLGDWTAPVAGEQFDVIVSNPPYVAAGDPALAALVAEPDVALVAGDSGYECIRRLAHECRPLLAVGGRLLLEHGNEQRLGVAAILREYGWHSIQCYDDYAGHPRVTSALFNNSETP